MVTATEKKIANATLVEKLACAMWMAKYDAPEKSFYRLRTGLRGIIIQQAEELVFAARKIGLKIEKE